MEYSVIYPAIIQNKKSKIEVTKLFVLKYLLNTLKTSNIKDIKKPVRIK